MKLLKMIAAFAMLRMETYLENQGKKNYMEAFPELLEAIEELDEEGIALLETEEMKKDSPYDRLIHFVAGGKKEYVAVAQSLLDFTVAVFLYPQFGAVLEQAKGYAVTVELAYFMENVDFPGYEDMRTLYENARVFLKEGDNTKPFFHVPFYGDNRLLGYLCQDMEMDRRLEEVARLFRPEDSLLPLMIRQDLCDSIEKALHGQENILVMKGKPGSGRSFLLCHALKKSGKGVVMVDMGIVLKRKKEIKELIRLIRREALFYSFGVCFHGITKEGLRKAEMSAEEFLLIVTEPLLKYKIPLFLCAEEGLEFLSFLSVPANQFLHNPLTRQERIALWEGYASYYEISLDAVQIGSKYKFMPGEIKRACLQLKDRGEKGDLDENSIGEILGNILPPILSKGTIEPYHPNCTLENLILPKETKEKVWEICAQVQYSHKVYDEWNMESKYAYGKAVSVLLFGPPGTGKTMMARVISHMLKLPLYHVNLSQLVDKYIGETEKHLEEIFSNAERSNTILFFDEADAVFGKRSQVSDAKDRYANTEVSYILQRMESYDGIVLLATNYKGNMDSAFMRRMKYILNFQLPGQEERLAIWKGCFPEESPVEEIDFEYLARQFEFSGSSIKNAALTSAFLAAREGNAISMRHLIRGIKNEYIKNGKTPFSSEFGEYGYLLG